MVALIFNALNILSSLLIAFLKMLLLLVDLGDEFFLMGELIEIVDLFVLGDLVLLTLLDKKLKFLKVLLKASNLLFTLLLSIGNLGSCFFLFAKPFKGFLIILEHNMRYAN